MLSYSEIVDLSWPYFNEMNLFPGANPIHIRSVGDPAEGALRLTTFDGLCMHYGTHLDCPGHVVKGGFWIKDKPASFFIGRGKVVDCAHYALRSKIGMEALDGVDLSGIEFLLFYIGWEKKMNTAQQFDSYPIFSLELASFLGKHPNLKGIGIESGNCDVVGDEDFPVHHALLESNTKILYEALTNLDQLIGKRFIFVGTPINIHEAEAAPCRAVALVD